MPRLVSAAVSPVRGRTGSRAGRYRRREALQPRIVLPDHRCRSAARSSIERQYDRIADLLGAGLDRVAVDVTVAGRNWREMALPIGGGRFGPASTTRNSTPSPDPALNLTSCRESRTGGTGRRTAGTAWSLALPPFTGKGLSRSPSIGIFAAGPASYQRQLERSTHELILVDLNPMLNGEHSVRSRAASGYAQPT